MRGNCGRGKHIVTSFASVGVAACTESQRAALWSVFEKVRMELDKRGLVTRSDMFSGWREAMAVTTPAV